VRPFSLRVPDFPRRTRICAGPHGKTVQRSSGTPAWRRGRNRQARARRPGRRPAIAGLFRADSRREEAQTAGSCSGRPPSASLQPADGKDLRSLDHPVHFISRQEAPRGDGGGGDQRLPHSSGREAAGQRLDAVTGPERDRLPLPSCAPEGNRANGGSHPCQEAPEAPGCSDPRRGEGGHGPVERATSGSWPA
jgi:hypothetical protein